MTESYPLQWPDHQQRTPRYKIQKARFDTTFDIARKLVFNEIRRLGGKNTVLSTNIPLRKDGFPYATAREPDDRGVAVYFDYTGNPMVFACDKWQTTKENVKAVAKTIDAIRGIERWGSSEMMEQAFRGFEALPSPEQCNRGWRDFFDYIPEANPKKEDLKARFRDFAKDFHPDHGGDPADWLALNAAYSQAKTELGFN